MAERTTSSRLDIWIPFLPPSENKIRVHRRQGGQVYSKDAKDFKKQFIGHIWQHYLVELNSFVQQHREADLYELEMHFTFDTVINKGWAKKQAKTLYKKFDVGNRRKLLEDCLVEVLGEIDDCLFFKLTMTKSMGEETGVRLVLVPGNPKDYGVPDVRQDQ